MKINKFIFLIILISLVSCGYEPIYTKKGSLNISINKIETKGNKNINRKIISLAKIKENNNESYAYNLNLNSQKNITVVAKDKSGNASVYKTTINVELSLKNPKNQNAIVKTKNFNSSFSYNNIKNKFDLQEYQKNIEQNLINRIVEEITIFLNS